MKNFIMKRTSNHHHQDNLNQSSKSNLNSSELNLTAHLKYVHIHLLKCCFFIGLINHLIQVSTAFLSHPVPLSSSSDWTFQCPNQFGHFPDGSSCSRYIVCDHWKPELHQCNQGLYYSTAIQTCDWPRNVDCKNGRTGEYFIRKSNSKRRKNKFENEQNQNSIEHEPRPFISYDDSDQMANSTENLINDDYNYDLSDDEEDYDHHHDNRIGDNRYADSEKPKKKFGSGSVAKRIGWLPNDYDVDEMDNYHWTMNDAEQFSLEKPRVPEEAFVRMNDFKNIENELDNDDDNENDNNNDNRNGHGHQEKFKERTKNRFNDNRNHRNHHQINDLNNRNQHRDKLHRDQEHRGQEHRGQEHRGHQDYYDHNPEDVEPKPGITYEDEPDYHQDYYEMNKNKPLKSVQNYFDNKMNGQSNGQLNNHRNGQENAQFNSKMNNQINNQINNERNFQRNFNSQMKGPLNVERNGQFNGYQNAKFNNQKNKNNYINANNNYITVKPSPFNQKNVNHNDFNTELRMNEEMIKKPKLINSKPRSHTGQPTEIKSVNRQGYIRFDQPFNAIPSSSMSSPNSITPTPSVYQLIKDYRNDLLPDYVLRDQIGSADNQLERDKIISKYFTDKNVDHNHNEKTEVKKIENEIGKKYIKVNPDKILMEIDGQKRDHIKDNDKVNRLNDKINEFYDMAIGQNNKFIDKAFGRSNNKATEKVNGHNDKAYENNEKDNKHKDKVKMNNDNEYKELSNDKAFGSNNYGIKDQRDKEFSPNNDAHDKANDMVSNDYNELKNSYDYNVEIKKDQNKDDHSNGQKNLNSNANDFRQKAVYKYMNTDAIVKHAKQGSSPQSFSSSSSSPSIESPNLTTTTTKRPIIKLVRSSTKKPETTTKSVKKIVINDFGYHYSDGSSSSSLSSTTTTTRKPHIKIIRKLKKLKNYEPPIKMDVNITDVHHQDFHHHDGRYNDANSDGVSLPTPLPNDKPRVKKIKIKQRENSFGDKMLSKKSGEKYVSFPSIPAPVQPTAPSEMTPPSSGHSSVFDQSGQAVAYEKAKKCNENLCTGNCRCGSALVPSGHNPKKIPQVVLLTFDDSVNDLNWEIYKELFDEKPKRLNPNGCPISATFYVSHEWTDYGQVQSLYANGHEIASHSITHSFGDKFSKNYWLKEIEGQKEIINLYGGVHLDDIRGMRAPFLQTGGNKMFEMLYEANFTYDSSLPVYDINPPFWPYTLDYQISHECMIPPCPTKSFPGLWEIGMVMWQDLRGGRCSMADACFNPKDEQGVYDMLKTNFNRHYNSNRAPFGMFFHSRWFLTEHNRKGFLKFIDEILGFGDVYFTTNWQLIQWIKSPVKLDKIMQFKPWQCNGNDDLATARPPPCESPHECKVKLKGELRVLRTCQECPKSYPWLGNNGKLKTN